jgi:hypothetical protein
MSTPNGPRMLRIGDAERVAAASALGDHFAAGRLDQVEFDERLGKAYAARTFEDLEPLFADLPEPRPVPASVPTAPPLLPPPAWESAPGPRDQSACDPWSTLDAWPSLRRSVRPVMARPGVAVRVVKTVFALAAALFLVSTIVALLPLIIAFSVVMWFAGGPIRRHRHWQRWHARPIGRPPWGGDNGAWFQFGWSSRDWSHTSGRGRPGHGYPRHGLPDQRPHRRRH